MLAGRVGGSMAAELATMRITEQIDALSCLGANPVHYLVVPRFLASLFLIPLLTILADLMGVLGGAFIAIHFYRIDSHFYWAHSREFVGLWDIGVGLVKSLFFGAALSLISCHRGFRGRGGSAGVGEAATQAFVLSFIAILALDFFLSLGIDSVHDLIWPFATGRRS
jgi:phospholipid/cholesterol/gamma-HCH transport system permease protein